LTFAEELKKLKNLKLRGISSHPGHVYSSTCEADIHKYVLDECETLKEAKGILEKEGYYLEYITSGSTPTFTEAVKDLNINVYHPGNYVFLDSIQLSINKAKVKDCALTVLATIISHPSENLFICDAGAKCLGLDQGAHGNSSIIGYGTVIDHPEVIVSSLSEEVGKLKAEGETSLKVGDKIEIIPNHSCSTANLCTYYTVVDGDDVIKSIKVDARGNSIKRI
jgi:serine racemase